MQKRNTINSPHLLELKNKRRKVFKNKIIISLCVVLFLFGSFAYVYHRPRFNIYSVEVKGAKILEVNDIKESVQSELNGKYFFLFPKSNIFFYPKKSILKALNAKFTGIKDVAFAVKGLEEEDFEGSYLEVSITEKTAVYTWCGESLPTNIKSDETCKFLDKDGDILESAPYFSPEVYFKFYGKIDLVKEDFQKITLFKKALENMNVRAVSLYISPSNEVKVFLAGSRSLDATNPQIIFNADADTEKVAENLQAALTTEPLLSNFKNKYSSLLYIDLRFGNKVYFKFK